MSRISLTSSDDSIDSVLINCVQSLSDFEHEANRIERPPEPTPRKMNFYNSAKSSEIVMEKNTMDYTSNVEEWMKNQDLNLTQQAAIPAIEDEAENAELEKEEQPLPSTSYFIKYDDSFLHMMEEEFLTEKLADGEGPYETASKRERPQQANYTTRLPKFTDPLIVDDFDDDELAAILAEDKVFELEDAIDFILSDSLFYAPKRERPQPANYRFRQPIFTDPLIVDDLDDDEFEAIFAEDEEVDQDIDEAIDFILSDKPLSKEKASNNREEIQSEKDVDSVAVDKTENECQVPNVGVLSVQRQENEDMEKIADLKGQLVEIIGPGQRNVHYNQPAQRDVSSGNEVCSGIIAPRNTPRSVRSQLPKVHPVRGGTLPSVMASSSKKSRACGIRGEVQKSGGLLYSVDELNLINQIERGC